jgi:hypothetical protein
MKIRVLQLAAYKYVSPTPWRAWHCGRVWEINQKIFPTPSVILPLDESESSIPNRSSLSFVSRLLRYWGPNRCCLPLGQRLRRDSQLRIEVHAKARHHHLWATRSEQLEVARHCVLCRGCSTIEVQADIARHRVSVAVETTNCVLRSVPTVTSWRKS